MPLISWFFIALAALMIALVVVPNETAGPGR